MKYLLSF